MPEQRQPRYPAHEPQSSASEHHGGAGEPAPRSREEEVRRGVFITAARLLAYPDDSLWALLPEIEAYLRELPPSDSVISLMAVTERLREAGAAKLEAQYVATFDFNEAAALYLTAHELGDSRRRGQALVELRRMLRAAGYEEATEELPDYLPLLLEFLAHAPADTSVETLERRLAAVCERIAAQLDTDNVFWGAFIALCDVLPKPAEANSEQRFAQREQADTGEMPYPLRYD